MDSNSQPAVVASGNHAGNGPPVKPREPAGTSSSGPAPFKPTSPGSTSDVVEASGTANPGEIVTTADRSNATNRNSLGRPVPTRPWEQQTYGSTYGGYGSGLNYNSGYGSRLYGSSYGGFGTYGGGLYGNNTYRDNYGGLYGGGMYGGRGLYNNGFGGPMGGYGVPLGDQDPNNPYGAPSPPPGFWVSFLRVMQGVVSFFGRISILIDQNTQALHMFMTTLLQLFDRTGVLYGELARFVLRLLGIQTKPRKVQGSMPDGLPAHHNPHGNQNYIEGPKAAGGGSWESVWGEGANS